MFLQHSKLILNKIQKRARSQVIDFLLLQTKKSCDQASQAEIEKNINS